VLDAVSEERSQRLQFNLPSHLANIAASAVVFHHIKIDILKIRNTFAIAERTQKLELRSVLSIARISMSYFVYFPSGSTTPCLLRNRSAASRTVRTLGVAPEHGSADSYFSSI